MDSNRILILANTNEDKPELREVRERALGEALDRRGRIYLRLTGDNWLSDGERYVLTDWKRA